MFTVQCTILTTNGITSFVSTIIDYIGGITNNLNLGLVQKPSFRVDLKN